MAESADFAWVHRLECPQSLTTDTVRHSLQKGVLGLLWEELSRVVYPVSEVIKTRKQILLYKLQKEPNDPVIQSIRKAAHLKAERQKLNTRIQNIKERWEEQEFSCRQKVQLLRKKESQKRLLEVKKNILKVKHQQLTVQVEKCGEMLKVCQHLMPPTKKEIGNETINECLSLVSNFYGGPEKRKVWKKLAETLGPIDVSTLWNLLLAARTMDTDLLTQLSREEIPSQTIESGVNLDIGIAKACGEHVNSVSKRFLHEGRTRSYEESIVEYVEKIEMAEAQNLEADWLPLTLEVKKLEVIEAVLQKEIAELKKNYPEETMLDSTLMELTSEIQSIDFEMAEYMQDFQRALGVLDTSGSIITKTKETLIAEMDGTLVLQNAQDNSWHDIDLNVELNNFQETISIEALRKIMLKGEVGAYRHLVSCFGEAFLSEAPPAGMKTVSLFPMLRDPMYYLVDLYKTILSNIWLNHMSLVNLSDEIPVINFDVRMGSTECIMMIFTSNNKGTFDLLQHAQAACQNTCTEIEEFEKIHQTWSKQSVQEIIPKIFSDRVAYGATFEEWTRRFSMSIYMLRKSNANAI